MNAPRALVQHTEKCYNATIQSIGNLADSRLLLTFALVQNPGAGQKEAEKLKSGEITKENYDQWRYRYPEFDTTQRWAKVPSQELSDALLEQFKKK